MRLYLLRHGHAPSITEAKVPSDRERPLSDKGRQDVRAAARELQGRGGRPCLILHSPLRRAVQTAEEALAVLAPAEGAEAFVALSNALPADETLAAIEKRLGAREEALAVGHQPQLGELAAHITGKLIELRPGGLVALELPQGAEPRVLWSYNPR